MADLIERDAAIDALIKTPGVGNRALDKVRQIPAVDAVPVVHGRWTCWEKGRVMCSICLREPFHGKGADALPYCPHCGARMDGGEQDAD